MKLTKLGPNISSFRALVGSVILLTYVGVALWQWVRKGELGGLMVGLLGLIVLSSIVGVFGKSALEAAASVLQDK